MREGSAHLDIKTTRFPPHLKSRWNIIIPNFNVLPLTHINNPQDAVFIVVASSPDPSRGYC